MLDFQHYATLFRYKIFRYAGLQSPPSSHSSFDTQPPFFVLSVLTPSSHYQSIVIHLYWIFRLNWLFLNWILVEIFVLYTVTTQLELPQNNSMLSLRRGLLQARGLTHTRYVPQTLYLSLTASPFLFPVLPTASYLTTRKYAKPRKPYVLPPSRRPLPVPSKREGIYPEVQDALRSANVSAQLRAVMRHMVHPGKTSHPNSFSLLFPKSYLII